MGKIKVYVGPEPCYFAFFMLSVDHLQQEKTQKCWKKFIGQIIL